MKISGRLIGDGAPCYLVAEIGINHNGSVSTALALVEAAAQAGADAVKFQIGDPERYVRREKWGEPRQTPWGVLPYIDYRKRMELSVDDLARTKEYAEGLGLDWFASPLEPGAVETLEALDVPCYKIASPMLTHGPLLATVKATGRPVIASTGMSTPEEVRAAYERLQGADVALLHCTSEYPAPPERVNLRFMAALMETYPCPVGLSDHTVGIPVSIRAAGMGAAIIERHLTLSRAMWGSDHAASLEPSGFAKMAEYIRTGEDAMGDGEKRVYEGERVNMRKFRLTEHAVAV